MNEELSGVDEKPSEKSSPESKSVGEAPDVLVGDIESSVLTAHRRPRRRRLKKSLIFSVCASIIGLGSLAASAWIYTDMRREMVRVSTEIAQLRLSLDLYVQRSAAATPAAATATEAPNTEALSALESRLAILEQNWRGVAAAAETAPQAAPSPNGPAVSAESDGDCLPSGTRLLVAAGDSYPVCGTETTIEVMNVNNGYISLTDGTTVPSGGTVPLPGTACMIAVTSGGDEATTGFAEIRVTC